MVKLRALSFQLGQVEFVCSHIRNFTLLSLLLCFLDVLDILGAALDENNIPYASLHNRLKIRVC